MKARNVFQLLGRLVFIWGGLWMWGQAGGQVRAAVSPDTTQIYRDYDRFRKINDPVVRADSVYRLIIKYKKEYTRQDRRVPARIYEAGKEAITLLQKNRRNDSLIIRICDVGYTIAIGDKSFNHGHYFCRTAAEAALKNGWHDSYVAARWWEGQLYLEESKPESALDSYLTGLNFAENHPLETRTAVILMISHGLNLACKRLNRNQVYEEILIKWLSIYKKQAPTSFPLSMIYQNLGLHYFYQRNYQSFLDYYLVGLKMLDGLDENPKEKKSYAFFQAGNILSSVGNFRLSIEYFRKALPHFIAYAQEEMKQNVKDPNFDVIETEAQTYQNIAAQFLSLSIEDSTIFYLDKCVEIRKNTHGQKLGSSYGMKALAYFQKKDYQKASDYARFALSVEENYVQPVEVILLNMNALLGKIAELKGPKDSLLHFYDRTKFIYANMKDKSVTFSHFFLVRRIEVLNFLVRQGLKSEDPADLTTWYDSLNACWHLLSEIENEAKVNDGLVRYDVHSKERLIQSLNREKILQEENKRKQALIILAMGFGLVISVILGTIIHIQSRIRKKNNLLLTRQKEEIFRSKTLLEKSNSELNTSLQQVQTQKQELTLKNKNIEESLFYARRIQQTILPDPSVLKYRFRDHCILYLPKQIVSGDFYWAYDKGDALLFGIADSSDHGVAGAFRSVVGTTALNQAIFSPHALYEEPDLILLEWDERMHRMMNLMPNESLPETLAAFCVYLPKAQMLLFSGASIDLWRFRNGELTEYQGSPYGLGGGEMVSKQFRSHRISLQPGDRIYLFSNGLTAGGRLFSPDELKARLTEWQNLPLDKQAQALMNDLTRKMSLLPDDISFFGAEIGEG